MSREPPITPRMLTEDQAARYCGVTVDAFLRACPVGVVAISGLVRYDRKAIDVWLDGLCPGIRPREEVALSVPVSAAFVPTFMTVKKAATRLRVSERTIYALVKSGALRHMKVGDKIIRIPIDAVAEIERGSVLEGGG